MYYLNLYLRCIKYFIYYFILYESEVMKTGTNRVLNKNTSI